VQHLEEGSKDTQFPTMRLSNKAHVPLSRTAQNLYIIRNGGILHLSNIKEIKKKKKKKKTKQNKTYVRTGAPHDK